MATDSDMEKRLERFSTPVLILAGVAIILYIFELFRFIPASLRVLMLWVNFLIDLVFLTDLTAKLIILKGKYVRSPWFFIDLVSTIPIISSTIELMGAVGPQLQATRAARGTRVARIARVARTARLAKMAKLDDVTKAVRDVRGQGFFKAPSTEETQTPSFNQALLVSVPVLLIFFMASAYYLTHQEVSQLEANLTRQVEASSTEAAIQQIPEYLSPHTARTSRVDKIYVSKKIDGRTIEFAFSAEQAHVRADRVQGLILVFTLLTVACVVYMSTSLASDQGEEEEESILLNFLSPSIVDKLDTNPEMVERFYSRWLSVFFVSIKGFTGVSAEGTENAEALAIRRRRIMDIVRNQIVVVHQGILDKFMGDTVMGWMGGPFSTYWNEVAALRERLALDELEFAEQDIWRLSQEIDALEQDSDAVLHVDNPDSTLPADREERLDYLKNLLQDVEANRTTLLAKHQAAKAETPDLEAQHEEAMQRYKREVAKTVVLCGLEVWEAVSQQVGDDAFNALSIGMASGSVFVGNFGSTDQIGFSVLGPTVDRAAWLEPAAAQCDATLLIDLETYELVKETTDLQFRMLPYLAVTGVSEPLMTYEPFKAGMVSQPFLDAFHEGVFAVERQDLESAIASFERADQLREGGDTASLKWKAECEAALRDGRQLEIKTIET